jgi:hypothetical protein
MVADIYKMMTDDPANCYDVDFPGSRKTKMCNIGKQLIVAFPTNGGDVQARLDVSIQFNGDTKEGSWNPDNMEGPIKDYFDNEVKDVLGNAMQWPKEKIVLRTSSQPEGCFNTKGWWFNEAWHENEACKF